MARTAARWSFSPCNRPHIGCRVANIPRAGCAYPRARRHAASPATSAAKVSLSCSEAQLTISTRLLASRFPCRLPLGSSRATPWRCLGPGLHGMARRKGFPRGAPRRPSDVQGRGPKQPSKRDSWAAFAGLLPAGRNRNGKTSVIAYRPIKCVRHLRRGHVADGVTEMQSSSWHPPSASTASAW